MAESEKRFMGIWTCWGNVGKWTLGGCHRVNLYVSRWRKYKPNVIDAKCRRCGKRRKFKPVRRDNRGGFRSVGFMWIPRGHEMTLEEGYQVMEQAQRSHDSVHGRFNDESFTTFERNWYGGWSPQGGGDENV